MWNGTKVTNWILSLKPQDLLLAFKISVGASSILYGLFFGYAVAVLFITLCLVAFKFPILIIYFNQFHFGAEITSLPDRKPKSKDFPKPLPPYFLIEDGPISPEVNKALESFLNGILEKFVIKWQSSLEVKEEQFISEARHIFKYIIIKLYQQLRKIDLPNLLIDKVIPILLWHFDCYSTGLEQSHCLGTEKVVLQCFGANIHPAILSRQTEGTYLKHCSEMILKDVFPTQLKTSKLLTILLRDILSCQILQNAMDALANPENINRLLIVWLEETHIELQSHGIELDTGVPILNSFTNDDLPKPKEMCMYPSLSLILKTPPHLYHLMQFLKRINTLKYLQFCFAVDEFNEKLLNPDLKLEQMKRLQLMGQKMFEIYFCHSSPDCIGFENESKDQMKSIVYANATEIVRLRTSPTLFQAYDHVMDILENKIMPRFYRSPEFYQLVTGANQSSGSSKNAKKKDESVSSGWGKKLRAALRPNWLATDPKLAGNSFMEPEEEGNYDTGIDLTEADFIADDLDGVEKTGAYADLIPVSGRDLTAWKTSIPRVVSAVDSSGKDIFAFEVDIQRDDLRPEDDPEEYHWTVIRTYLEFFYLESKLTEFHGEFVNKRLPPKKMFGTRSLKFLESVRLEFESFLRTLLQQPALKGSDLIFSFLTLSDLSACISQANSDSSVMGSNLLPDLGFSRMMRHVPMKLRKERGQDLESFLQTFIASTEAPKPKPSKIEVRDVTSEVSVPIIKELHPIFKDNAKTFLTQDGPFSRSALSRAVYIPKLSSPYDCVLFLAWKIWKIPSYLSIILVGLRSCLSVYFNSYARKYVMDKCSNAMKPDRISLVINLLHDTVLNHNLSDKNEVDFKQGAWNSIVKSIPEWLKRVFGSQPIEERCKEMFQCLQLPVLNKQISYVLLDIMLNEVFPEIFSTNGANPSL